MDIEGTYTLQAPQEEVWHSLIDQETLQHTVPGLEHFETLGKNSYAFTLRIKQAPLRGVYQGQAVIDDAGYPTVYRLSFEGHGQQNRFQGLWEIHLRVQNENTIVAYTGMLNPGKVGVFLRQPLVKGAIKILIQQFFTNLAEQLRTTGGALNLVLTNDTPEAQERYSGRISGETSSPGLPQQSRLQTLVHQIGLGEHDPLKEEAWVTRLKRFGAFSVLLLLVWLGTRLPRQLFPHD